MSDLDAESRGQELVREIVAAMERSTSATQEARTASDNVVTGLGRLTTAIETQTAVTQALANRRGPFVTIVQTIVQAAIEAVGKSKMSVREVALLAVFIAQIAALVAGWSSGNISAPALNQVIETLEASDATP